MSSQNNYDVRKLRMDDITILNAQITNKPELSALQKGEFQFAVEHKFELATYFEGKSIRLIQSSTVETLDNKTQKPIQITAKFDIAYFFFLENFNDIFAADPEVIEDNIASSLINICYSTSRGIMFTRCQGTVMKNLIIPILPTDEILNFKKEVLSTEPKKSSKKKSKK